MKNPEIKMTLKRLYFLANSATCDWHFTNTIGAMMGYQSTEKKPDLEVTIKPITK